MSMCLHNHQVIQDDLIYGEENIDQWKVLTVIVYNGIHNYSLCYKI